MMQPIRGLATAAVIALTCSTGMTDERHRPVLVEGNRELPIRTGVEAWIGIPDDWTAQSVIKHCQEGNRLIYVQVRNEQVATEIREAALANNLLGKRIFVSRRGPKRIGISDGLCLDCRVAETIANLVPESEVLRVLIPGASGHIGERVVTAPKLIGTDVWTHPYHAPDNNPCSRDHVARGAFETRYIAYPHFSPMPQISVAGYGRLYRAMGHIAHKANQVPTLNTLVGVDIASGCILWRRSLPEGFMIHRNTWVAVTEGIWVGDDIACRLLDRDTGRELRRIEVPEHVGGPVWKWIGLVDQTLYALVGDREIAPSTQRSDNDGLGHWGWSMWEGHDYPDPQRNFAFGNVVCAFDLATGKLKWSQTEKSPIDGRAVCLSGDRLFYFCPGHHLVCLGTADGSLKWSNADTDLLAAIGEDAPAQSFLNGYSTQFYLACDDERLYFAGPQRPNFIAVGQSDGKMLWLQPEGVRHVVAHPQGLFVVTDIRNKIKSGRIDTSNGELLEELYPRRGCTRVTGSLDSLFLRARNGTIRQLLDGDRSVNNIAPMRPPCHSGVIISDGMLCWGPWMCGCNLSFYGHVGLGPKSSRPEPDQRIECFPVSSARDALVTSKKADWPRRILCGVETPTSGVSVEQPVSKCWEIQIGDNPTPALIADGLVVLADSRGVVQAVDQQMGKKRWAYYLDGPVFVSPQISGGVVVVGGADGRVHAVRLTDGKLLWRHLIAIRDERIHFYDRLISRWPLSGGIVVHNGIVCAAAGIAHYDGLRVCALSLKDGQPIWCNDSSGVVNRELRNGVSLQGPLHIKGDELCFAGGSPYSTVRYRLHDGELLNAPFDKPEDHQKGTASPALYPLYGQFVSLHHRLSDGRILDARVMYEGSKSTPLALYPAGSKLAQRANLASRRVSPLWRQPAGTRYNAFVVCGESHVLHAEQTGSRFAPQARLVCARIADGNEIWSHTLPQPAVRNGCSVAADGTIVVCLRDGGILALR